jgi:flagellar export protein FliJ
MRRFEFRLATLLRVRELRELEALRRFAAQQAEIARLDRLIREAQKEIDACHGVLRGHLREPCLDPLELTRLRAWVGLLRRQLLERQELRSRRAAGLEQLRRELRRARTQKQSLERLRERRWQEYRRVRNLREGVALDELARQMQSRLPREPAAADAGPPHNPEPIRTPEVR